MNMKTTQTLETPATGQILARGKHYLGKLTRNCDTDGTRNCRALVTWELKQVENGLEFSACGEVWNHIQTDCVMCGQCVDNIVKHFPHDKRAVRILAIWQGYHLNGMNAGTPVQTAAIREWEAQGNRYEFSAACDMLKARGLYEVPIDDSLKATGGFPADVQNGTRGYHYGERWIYRPIPDDVIAEILSWSI